MVEISSLMIFTGATLLLMIVPGPSMTYVLSRSISQGVGGGVVSALGISAGSFLHVAASILGLSAVVAQSAELFTLVKWCGAAYLIYIGISSLIQKKENKPKNEQTELIGKKRLFMQGFIVEALNPKDAIFFLTFLPQFVRVSQGNINLQLSIYGLTFITIATIADVTYAVLGGKMKDVLNSPSFERYFQMLSGFVLIGLGIKIAFTKK